MRGVPFTYYNNSQEMHNRWPAINALGVLGERPVWELIYNHYEVLKGVPAPYCKRMAELLRPEHGSKDHFGYEGLKADASIGKVFLEWKPAAGFTANGYVIQRSEGGKNDFKDIAVYEEKVLNCYTDFRVEAGKRYDYRVAALNKTGRSSFSSSVQACPVEAGGLPAEWRYAEIGQVESGYSGYAKVCGGSFVLAGVHTETGRDGTSFCCGKCLYMVAGMVQTDSCGRCVLCIRITGWCELVLCTFGEDKNAAEDICGADCLLPGG